MLVVEHLRNGVGVALVDDGVLRVAAVVVPTREARRHAQVLVVATTEAADPAGPPKPRDPHPVAHGEAVAPLAQGIDGANDLARLDDIVPADAIAGDRYGDMRFVGIEARAAN